MKKTHSIYTGHGGLRYYVVAIGYISIESIELIALSLKIQDTIIVIFDKTTGEMLGHQLDNSASLDFKVHHWSHYSAAVHEDERLAPIKMIMHGHDEATRLLGLYLLYNLYRKKYPKLYPHDEV